MRDHILEYCSVDILEEHMFLDVIFDNALLGVCYTMEDGFIPAYDIDLVIDKITENDNLTYQEALNFFNNNILEAYPMISFIKKSDESEEELSDYNKEMLFLPDYNKNTLVGVKIQQDRNVIAVYDDFMCIQSLIDEGLTEEDAIEHFEYNTRGSYVGENTPAFLTMF
jgi:hypothetical protein